MKLKGLFAAVMAALIAVGLMVPGATLASAKGKKAAKAVVVAKDAPDDWGTNVDPELAPFGEHIGQELIGGAIGMKDKKTINFVFQLKSLPPWGGYPEFTRYVWDFKVNNKPWEIDGKFTNYSRGACDPTSKQCPPPRDPGLQPFLVRGNCYVEALQVTNLTVCEEVARVQAIFDPAAGTITVPVPAKAIGAKPGAKITGDAGTFGGSLAAVPSAFVSSDGFPSDAATQTKTFVVPR